jgi:hypothetical protein
MPAGIDSAVHVVPPLVVLSAPAALVTAVHVVVDGHEIEDSGAVPAGRLWVLQVAPPLVVATATPRPPVVPPTAVHCVGEGHEIPANELTPAGGLWVVQLVPPSVLATMRVPPTATQSAGAAHEMALSGWFTP